jgi:hypothetical protein
MKTERIVSAIPLESTLRKSWQSILFSISSSVLHLSEVGQSHVISKSDLSVLVTNNRKRQCTSSNFVNIIDPSAMSLDRVCREADQFDTTLGELWRIFRQSGKLCRTHWCVIFRMRKKDCPFIADPFVKIDRANRRLSLEVGGNGAQSKARWQRSACMPSARSAYSS